MPLPAGVVIDNDNGEKPYHEWVRGVFYPKMSPSNEHGRISIMVGSMLVAWGKMRGIVATEVDLDVTPEQGDTRRYLPDVIYTSFESIERSGQAGRSIMEMGPELVVEVCSPADQSAYVADKIRSYLAAGSLVVLYLDWRSRTMQVHRPGGVESLGPGQTFSDPAFPGLALALDEIFGILDVGPKGRPGNSGGETVY
jgi:Uma2 family endonuclease